MNLNDVELKINELERQVERLTLLNSNLEEQNNNLLTAIDPLTNVSIEVDKLINLKELELKQQWFFIELIEECLPISDGKKRILHEKAMRSVWMNE